MLASNRDESVVRYALAPRQYQFQNVQALYPVDVQSKGTWLSIADNGYILCLLNGAHTKHVSQPPYRQSRGLVIPHFFEFNDVETFASNYTFEGIEPFTLIIIHAPTQQIDEVRWDGNALKVTPQNANEAQIWSSVTLYTEEVRQQRREWFAGFLAQYPSPELHDLLHFHHFGGSNTDQSIALKMQRGDALKTTSITGIEVKEQHIQMRYKDCLTQTESLHHVTISSNR